MTAATYVSMQSSKKLKLVTLIKLAESRQTSNISLVYKLPFPRLRKSDRRKGEGLLLGIQIIQYRRKLHHQKIREISCEERFTAKVMISVQLGSIGHKLDVAALWLEQHRQENVLSEAHEILASKPMGN